MQCEEFLEQLNAYCDGELTAQEAAACEAHVAGCAKCREAVAGVRSIDSDLREAFRDRRGAAARLAESAVTRIRDNVTLPVRLATPPSAQSAWIQLFVAAAAGFLLAVVVFRPWNSNGPHAPVQSFVPIAHLALASGPVEVQSPKTTVFSCPTGSAIERNSIIRTGPETRCEISLADGSALRLDCNTEVKLRDGKTVEMNRGRLCATNQSTDSGLEVQSTDGAIVAKPAAQLAVECNPKTSRFIAVNGPVSVTSGLRNVSVNPGQQLRVIDGKMQDNLDWCDPLIETSWVNGVLALGNSDHPELAQRVNQLLANVGAAKLSLMYEDELRRLGDDGVPPLLAYLAATREKPTAKERVLAARVVADVSQPRWMPDLIALLTDANPKVRSEAARGLERLAGKDQGLKPADWTNESSAEREIAYQKWVNWWEENRERYPNAKREIPAPTLPTT
jgi:ferric-dicitrate binding protein FerR (iron transport regulator)